MCTSCASSWVRCSYGQACKSTKGRLPACCAHLPSADCSAVCCQRPTSAEVAETTVRPVLPDSNELQDGSVHCMGTNLTRPLWVAAAGLALMYLGSSLLLSRLSAEAANIRYDVNLLWTNKFDRWVPPHARSCIAKCLCDG